MFFVRAKFQNPEKSDPLVGTSYSSLDEARHVAGAVWRAAGGKRYANVWIEDESGRRIETMFNRMSRKECMDRYGFDPREM